MKKIFTPIILCCLSLMAAAQTFTHTLSTDGVSQFASLPNGALSGKTVFTIEFWVKTTESRTSGTYWQKPTLIGEARNAGNDGDFGITLDNKALGMWHGFSSDGNDKYLQTNTMIADNQWHHIAAVNNGTYIYLYADGVKLDSLLSGNPIITTGTPLTIGASALNFDFSGGSSYARTTFNAQANFAEVRISDNVRYTGHFSPAASYTRDAHTVALYDFASPCGLKIKDLSTHHNDLVANVGNASCKTLPFGSGYTYDGVNQFTRVPGGVLDGLSTFTIEGWVKTTDVNTSGTFWQCPTIVGTASPGGNSGDFGISTQGGYLVMWHGMNNGENYVITKAFISDNKWHHIAASANGTAIRIFADGVLLDSLAITRGLNTASYPLTLMGLYAPELGTANHSTYFFHSGTIDEFRFSNTARYTTGFTVSGGPFTSDASTVSLYHLNGCSGAYTPDASPNKDSARMYNFTACALPPQLVQGKILYSHHTAGATNPDSIFTLVKGKKSFITLGYRPRLSHNGKYLAYSNGPNPNSSLSANLYIRNLLTGDEAIIANNSDYLDYYDFYPADQKLVYSQGCSIYTVNLDGSNAYTYLGGYPGDCFSDDPMIRKSDSVITYHNVHYGLFTTNPDGSGSAQIPNTVPGDLCPTWSADGKWLAYYKPIPGSYNGGAGAYVPTNSVYKIKPDGTDSTRLSFFTMNDTLAADPIWAKDGKSLYAIGRINDTMGIYQVTTDGSGKYTRVYTFEDTSGVVADYWLGLTDSVATGILPVQLLNFTGTNLGKAVQLNWRTAQEINSDYFNVERSVDGRHFNYIGKVAAAGNSSSTQDYGYTDYAVPAPVNKNIYYRLKQVDKDGHYEYSSVVSINIEKVTAMAVYPNPCKGIFNLVTGEVNQKLDVQVYDATGRIVYHNNFSNTNAALISLPGAKGVYMMKITTGKTTTTKKLVVE